MADLVVAVPTVAIVGYGRAGKDTLGAMLGERTRLRYTGSLSWYALDLMSSVLGVCKQLAWETRHQRREEWKRIIDEHRDHDPGMLINAALKEGEIVVGIRDSREIEYARQRNLFKYIIWVDRPGIPVDPTVAYDDSVADVVFSNSGDLDQMSVAVDKLIVDLKLPRKI